jgi:hypothetical protein
MNAKNQRKNMSEADYKKAAKTLKESNILKNVDLRKKFTPYQKRKIRDLVRKNDGALYRMAKYRQETKARKYLSEKLDFDYNNLIDAGLLAKKMQGLRKAHKRGEISDAVFNRTLNYYRDMRHHITGKNVNNNYGLQNFTVKKVNKTEAEILKENGWVVIGNKAYLPTSVNHSKSYLGIRYYKFPNGIEHPALVESIKNTATKHSYKYFLLGDAKVLTRLLQNLERDGVDSIYPDLMYTSPSRSKDAIRRSQFFPSIKALLNYVGGKILTRDEHKNKTQSAKDALFDMFVTSIHILSHKKPIK